MLQLLSAQVVMLQSIMIMPRCQRISARNSFFQGRWRQGGAAGCALYTLRERAAAGSCRRRLVSITVFLAQVSAASAASECEGIILQQQNNEEHRDEAERSERSPPGVARNAGVEGVDGRSPASKRRSRARERKCFATGPASATGEGGRGTCATSPGAIRKSKVPCSLPSGHLTCSCAQAKQALRTPCLLLRQ